MVELERLKLYEPETQQKKYVESGTRMSRKNTGLSLTQRTKIEGSKDFDRDFKQDFQKHHRKNHSQNFNLKYSLQHESIPIPPTIFKRQFTGYGRKLVQIRCCFVTSARLALTIF